MKLFIFAFTLCAAFNISAQVLTMKIANSEVNGSTITYDITADNFTDMVAMQYSINYDAQALEFISIDSMGIPDLNSASFNTGIPGSVLNSWIDNTVSGVTLDDGALIYQIKFELLGQSPGDVCFSEDPIIIEFVNVNVELNSFMIVDDCYPEPHEVLLTVSTEEIAAALGFQISTFAQNAQVNFILDKPLNIDFRVFDMSGKMVASIPMMSYGSGSNSLNLNSSIPAGMYILTTVIEGQPIAMRFIK